MTARYIDIENQVLRNRLKEQRDTITRLCATVRRYVRQECLRSELLNTVNDAEAVADGGGAGKYPARTMTDR